MRKHINKFIALIIASAIVAGASKFYANRKALTTEA